MRTGTPFAGSAAVAGLALAALVAACDLPPGIDTLDPGEAEPVPPGIAEVQGPPTDDAWTTDSLAWQPGGETSCPPPPGGDPASPVPPAEPRPFVIEIWDGLADACGETPDTGDRAIRLSLSDLVAGTFDVAPGTCVGPLTAGGVFRSFVGTQEERRVAAEGTVTITGIDANDVVDGVFSVRFDGDTAMTSGGFRAEPGCVSSGR